ncbi:PAS domain-containing sensor histidine kinase [Rubrivivax sp. RP6-9]|uniref:PAS domain-containing sensor histidine kinase n=1 Tax=Rubrivivax sp. RP6-9 TaxID=3415750 RepID=UPI003CC6C1F6
MTLAPRDPARQLLDALPLLALTAAPTGAVDFVNRPWCQYTGLDEAGSMGWGWAAALHPGERDDVLQRWCTAAADGTPVEIELRLRRADGDYRWHLARAQALRSPAGAVVGWCGTCTDVENRRRTDQALQDSERAARLVVDTIPALVFTTTVAGTLEYANQRHTAYFGRTLEELRAWEQTDAIHPDDLPRVVADWQRYMAAGEPCDAELRQRRADGVYRWFHYRAVPARDATGAIVRWFVLATDIEDLHTARGTLLATQAQLARAAQLAALSELSASIAHEINQPLAAIIANDSACRRWLTGDPPNVERALVSVDRIVRDGHAAADVVRRMQSLFRRAPPLRAPLDINALVVEVLALLRDEFRGRGIVWQTRLADGLPAVQADRVQIQQVLFNLLRNGAEAMDGVEGRPRTLTVATRQLASDLVVAVADHGVGIPAGSTAAMFESFYTTKPNGMGMGLAICRSIAEAHGGRLEACRDTPFGSTFTLVLPLGAAADVGDATGPA